MPKKIPETIKEDIKDFVKEQLKDNNISKISIRYIAKNLDVSVGTIYNYFESKEDIYFELAKDYWKLSFYGNLKNIENAEPKEAMSIIFNSIKEYNMNIRQSHINIKDKEKYYLHFILYKRMKVVVENDILETIKNVLKNNNIKLDKFIELFIVRSLMQNIMSEDEEKDSLIQLLEEIIESKGVKQ